MGIRRILVGAHMPLLESGNRRIARNALSPRVVIQPDKDAAEIGDQYRKARLSALGSTRFAFECGQRLIAKRYALKRDGHGSWLPWLRNNVDALGIETPRSAQ